MGEATIVDVLENFLDELTADRVQNLTKDELAELAEAVNVFYGEWEPPRLSEDELRLYSGGWIAGNVEAPEVRRYLFTSLLYAPGVVIHDPVADWFDPQRSRVQSPSSLRAARGGIEVQVAEPQLLRSDGYHAFREEPDRSRTSLIAPITLMAELAPLIRGRVVVPVPQWRIVRQRQTAILTAVRHDVHDPELAKLITDRSDAPPPRADRIRGMELMPEGGYRPVDAVRAVVQNPSYFLNKTLAIADATTSRYVPPAVTDAVLLEYRIRQLGRELERKDIDMQVVAALNSSELPFLADLDAATILEIRRDEPSFSDWRANLRSIARTIELLPSNGDEFVKEAREIMSDALMPAAREIRAAVSRSAVMKSAAGEHGLTLGIGAASVAGGALVTGAPIAVSALAGLGLTAIGRWTFTSLFGTKPRGTNGVLARLVKNW